MYSFKVFKNGKKKIPPAKPTSDKNIAFERWEKMQSHYEQLWYSFGYSYSIEMLKDNETIHTVDYES